MKTSLAGLSAPHSLHLLVTSQCNLACRPCYYRSRAGEWGRKEALALVAEMAELGVSWLAIGGGEPLLWEPLPRVLDQARSLGIKTTVTTNGTLLRPLRPDRVHVSHDPLHLTSRQQVLTALAFYRSHQAEVGINTLAEDLSFLESLPYPEVDHVVYLLPKPAWNPDPRHWQQVWDLAREYPEKVWLDACLARLFCRIGLLRSSLPCRQGLTSLSLQPDQQAGPCSNLSSPVRWQPGRLQQTWERVRGLPPCFMEAVVQYPARKRIESSTTPG
jgi:hypothetical protein